MTDEENWLDRRGALRCMGWAGTGALFSMSGGIAASTLIESALARAVDGPAIGSALRFVQISDTHIGFNKPANPDPVASLRTTIARIKALAVPPDFVVHTGDVTHLATAQQFDMAQQLLGEIGLPVILVPGEHDLVDGVDTRPFNSRFGRDVQGDGWFSFDAKGVHFIGLVNAAMLGDRGQGTLGQAQIDWLRKDLAPLSASTPIVLLSHFPLWPLYPDWGWGTADAAGLFDLLRRFGSVTSLNGHVHQIQQKVEGALIFHAARSTAYPQPAPGMGAGPGPLMVPPDQLAAHIGMTSLVLRGADTPIAVTDETLA